MTFASQMTATAPAVLDAIAAECAQLLNPASDPSWIRDLIGTCWSAKPLRVSSSTLGVLVSAESVSPQAIRLAVQPGEHCSRDQLAAILRSAAGGAEAADAVSLLGAGSGSVRGSFEVAFGIDGKRTRVYLSTPQADEFTAQIAACRRDAWWPADLSDALVGRLERLRSSVRPVGCARDFPGPASFKLYFASAMALRQALLDYALSDESPAVLETIRQLLGAVRAPADAAPAHYWSFTVGPDGELLDWKLELMWLWLDVAGVLSAWPSLTRFASWVEDVAERSGALAAPIGACVRVRGSEPSVLLYYGFHPAGLPRPDATVARPWRPR